MFSALDKGEVAVISKGSDWKEVRWGKAENKDLVTSLPRVTLANDLSFWSLGFLPEERG